MRDIAQPALDAPAADWQVYGDALQEAGDPRGELIALSIAVGAGKDPLARERYLRAHWPAIVGTLPADRVSLAWRYCLIERAELRQTGNKDQLARQLVASPAARELRAVELRGISRDDRMVDLAPAMRVLEGLPATCRSIALVDHLASQAEMLVSRDFAPDPNLVTFGPLDPLIARAETFTIDVADANQLGLGMAGLAAPELRTFALCPLRFSGYYGDDPVSLVENLEAVARAAPKLEDFELRCCEAWMANLPIERKPYVSQYGAREGDEGEGALDPTDWAILLELLEVLAERPLRRLALTSFASARSMLGAIALAGLAPTVRVLDLSHARIDDPALLLEHRGVFAQLDRLVLRQTPLPGGAWKQQLGCEVVHTRGDGATYRYVVGRE